jgi:multicomponent K+:H+ antiporter subunit A
MASGLGWTEARQRIEYHALIAAGVLVAAAAGVGSWLFGAPFLSSSYTYVNLWPLEEFELATAAIFDLGVFLCVLGAVLLALNSLSRMARRAGETVSADPYSVDRPEGGN